MRNHYGKIAVCCGVGVLGILAITVTFPASSSEHLLAAQAAVMLSLIGGYSFNQWRNFRDARGRYRLIGLENKPIAPYFTFCRYL